MSRPVSPPARSPSVRGAETAPVEDVGAARHRGQETQEIDPAPPPGIVGLHPDQEAERQAAERERRELRLGGERRPIHLDQHEDRQQERQDPDGGAANAG